MLGTAYQLVGKHEQVFACHFQFDVAVSALDNCQQVCHRLVETAGCKTSRFGSIINEKPLPRLG